MPPDQPITIAPQALAAVRAFVQRVEERAYRMGPRSDPWAVVRALDDELAALEVRVTADAEESAHG